MLSTGLSLTVAQAEAILSRWLDRSVRCHAIEPLPGGMINTALRLKFDRSPSTAVIKLNADRDSSGLRSERARLDYLQRHTRLPMPRVYWYGTADAVVPYSYLLLETIPGFNMTQVKLTAADRVAVERELADALIELHGHNRPTFGRVNEPGVESWAEIFVPELRTMQENVEGRLPTAVLSDIDAAIERAPDAFKDQGTPTLIHADIWAGNIMVDRRGGDWHLTGLVDPSAAKFADVESELAYLQIFDTVGATFFDLYTAVRPLRHGYLYRRLFYWLNTCLTHIWLLGKDEFGVRAAEVAAQIVASDC